MTTDDNLELSLTCAICLDLASADNAVETSCCHQLFCLTCIENVQPCPSCRKTDFQTVPAHFARRLIGSMTVLCPNEGCGAKVSRSNLAGHLAVHCPHGKMSCPDAQCTDFKCAKKLFLEHLITKHGELLLDKYQRLWQTDAVIVEGITISPSAVKTSVRVDAPAASNTIAVDDRMERTRNKFGRYARLGSSGKFYCGGELDGFRCSCCNGRCGVSNGCNCSGCMLLDVQKRQLPPGWLVNREGASARCSPEEPTKFYCGRNVMPNDRRTDGYCGPTNGEQCSACLKLNEQQNRRYGQVWSN